MPLVSALAAVAARGYGFLQGRFSDFELIETQTVGSGGQASIIFNSIPQTYKHLQVRMIANTTSTATYALMKVNNDSGSNYNWHYLQGSGSGTPSSGANATFGGVVINDLGPGSGSASTFGAQVITILDYASTTKNKTVQGLGGFDNNGSGYIHLESNLWRNSTIAAITSLTITPASGNLAQYSTFSLYGVK